MGFIADVFDVTLIDTENGDVFGSTTLTDAGLEFSMDESEIRGGRGNSLLGVLHSNKDIAINLTDVSFRYEFMARNLGADIVTGAGIAYATPKNYVVEDGGAGEPIVTLDETPNADDDGVVAYTTDGQKITGFAVTGADVDFTGATPAIATGDEVEIRTYRYDTDAATETIEFDYSKFPKGVQCVLETVEIDGGEKITHKIQYQLDNAVPQGNFSISTSSAREATSQDFNLRVIKNSNSSVVGRALRIPVGETTV